VGFRCCWLQEGRCTVPSRVRRHRKPFRCPLRKVSESTGAVIEAEAEAARFSQERNYPLRRCLHTPKTRQRAPTGLRLQRRRCQAGLYDPEGAAVGRSANVVIVDTVDCAVAAFPMTVVALAATQLLAMRLVRLGQSISSRLVGWFWTGCRQCPARHSRLEYWKSSR
jgi:hypothetical protein